MAKSIAPVWLIVALTVIVRIAPSFQKDGPATDPSKSKDWPTMGKACVAEITPRREWAGGIEHEWLYTLKGVSRRSECTEGLKKRLLDLMFDHKDKHPKCFKLMKEYLPLYLDKCGYEEAFRQAIDYFKRRPAELLIHAQHATLDSYIKSKYSDKSIASDELKGLVNILLSALENFSKLDGISKETDCTQKLQADSIDLLRQTKHNNLEENKLIKGVFALYLDKCGYQVKFKRTIEHFEQRPLAGIHWKPDKYPTLYSCFEGQAVGKRSHLSWVLSAIEKTSALTGMRFTEGTECTETLDTNIVEPLVSGGGDEPFDMIANNYLALYLNKCGFDDMFNKRIEHMNQSSTEHWNLEAHPTLVSALTEEFSKKWPLGRKLAVIKGLSKLESISALTDCTDKLHDEVFRLLHFKETTKPFAMIVNDYFALYLENCGFEQSFKQRIVSIEQDSDGPWDSDTYPTLYRLLRSKFWKQKMLSWLLPNLKQISYFDGAPEQLDCPRDLRSQFLHWIERSRKEDRDLYILMRDYFALYYDKCGATERLEKELIENEDDESLVIRIVDEIF